MRAEREREKRGWLAYLWMDFVLDEDVDRLFERILHSEQAFQGLEDLAFQQELGEPSVSKAEADSVSR